MWKSRRCSGKKQTTDQHGWDGKDRIKAGLKTFKVLKSAFIRSIRVIRAEVFAHHKV
jgi:hypothetical protein